MPSMQSQGCCRYLPEVRRNFGPLIAEAVEKPLSAPIRMSDESTPNQAPRTSSRARRMSSTYHLLRPACTNNNRCRKSSGRAACSTGAGSGGGGRDADDGSSERRIRGQGLLSQPPATALITRVSLSQTPKAFDTFSSFCLGIRACPGHSKCMNMC